VGQNVHSKRRHRLVINTNTLERLQHAEDLYVLQPYLPQKARLIVRPDSGDFHTIYPKVMHPPQVLSVMWPYQQEVYADVLHVQ